MKRRFYQVRPGLGTRAEGDTSVKRQPQHHAASRSPVSQPSAEPQTTSNTGIAGTGAFAIMARRATSARPACGGSSCAFDPAREGGEPWLRNDVDSRGAAKPVGFYGSDWQ